VIGGLAGIGAGLLACGAYEGGHDREWDRDLNSEACDGAGEWVGVPLVAGAVYGGIGALIGHFIKSDRWVEVPGHRVRVSFGVGERGLGVVLSLRF
jgi:hypothetical protein